MRRILLVLSLALFANTALGQAHLVPVDPNLPPLAMVAHQVKVTIDEQAAETKVEQTFRNNSPRQVEVTYVFPVPKGADVRRFSMWVGGKEVPGELVEADKARGIYTDIVRRTLDPGLLEHIDNQLFRLKIFPVPAYGEQKIAITYNSVTTSENGLIEFVYPMGADNKAFATHDKFSLNLQLKSQFSIQNVYSPSHAITMTRPNDREANVSISKDQVANDKDFHIYYTIGTKDVGVNMLTHRPSSGQNGYFMLLVSPRAELSKSQKISRDMVFVLDTSGSMHGRRIVQARNALKYCLENLTPEDRFGLMNFATSVNQYATGLLPATRANVQTARKWVDTLEATGGTAIDAALEAALAMRTADSSRPFTIVFFTDGQPTIGETDPKVILKNVAKRNTANTRIFSFGVGDDVNATFLDALSENTRATSSFVRESEDIEAKVSGLYSKISNPLLANLKLNIEGDVKVSEMYPPQLPDLFHGTQLVVFGRYTGSGKAKVHLTGAVGKEKKDFNYEASFPEQTAEEKPFVEDLWARRKVGYLLDQIRANGQKKELVDEVVTLAKRHGIATPYTSYLVVPDAPVPVAGNPPPVQFFAPAVPAPVPTPNPFPGGDRTFTTPRAPVTIEQIPLSGGRGTSPFGSSPYGSSSSTPPTGASPYGPPVTGAVNDKKVAEYARDVAKGGKAAEERVKALQDQLKQATDNATKLAAAPPPPVVVAEAPAAPSPKTNAPPPVSKPGDPKEAKSDDGKKGREPQVGDDVETDAVKLTNKSKNEHKDFTQKSPDKASPYKDEEDRLKKIGLAWEEALKGGKLDAENKAKGEKTLIEVRRRLEDLNNTYRAPIDVALAQEKSAEGAKVQYDEQKKLLEKQLQAYTQARRPTAPNRRPRPPSRAAISTRFRPAHSASIFRSSPKICARSCRRAAPLRAWCRTATVSKSAASGSIRASPTRRRPSSSRP